jgi:hypothetical protein
MVLELLEHLQLTPTITTLGSSVGVNTHSQIDAHIADLAQHRLINDSGTSTIELFSASKVLALIAVNGAIAGTLILKEAATTPDLDVAPAGAIQQGWTYVVTVAGTLQQKVRREISRNKMRLLRTTPVQQNIPAILPATTTVVCINFSYSK